MKIGIIGGGIAGVAAAYYLGSKFDITLFEKKSKIGGNVDTHFVTDDAGKELAIDTGFISFNTKNYPLFTQFLRSLNIPFEPSIMSFGISDDFHKNYSAGSNYAKAILDCYSDQKEIYQKIKNDLNKFPIIVADNNKKITAQMTMLDFVDTFDFSDVFADRYLYPVSAGLFSQSINDIKKFPVRRILNYFQNHNLMNLDGFSDCLYVKYGYNTYLEKALLGSNIITNLNAEVTKVEKNTVYTKNKSYEFDAIIIACEADIALKLLAQPTPLQQDILTPFRYKINTGYLHSDTSIFDTDAGKWATHLAQINADQSRGCYSIWLNNILKLESKTPYFMTLNSWQSIQPKKIISKLSYRHLILDEAVIKLQPRLHELNNNTNTYFVGSYYKYFHEDAMRSSLQVTDIIKKKFNL